jgi:hypothetical protein
MNEERTSPHEPSEPVSIGSRAGSTTNLAPTSLATDMVFRDGVSLETPTMSGSVDDGPSPG